jgi:hypothetical protein
MSLLDWRVKRSCPSTPRGDHRRFRFTERKTAFRPVIAILRHLGDGNDLSLSRRVSVGGIIDLLQLVSLRD